MRNCYKKGFNRIVALLGAMLLIVCALYIPMMATAAATINSVNIKDDEAFVFDFEKVVTDSNANKEEALGAAGIGYFGWGWKTTQYTVDGKVNTVLDSSKRDSSQYWSTGSGYRLHTLKEDGTYGFFALEPSTKYMVSFKIRVLSSPVTVSGSSSEANATVDLSYNMIYYPNSSWAPAGSYINYSPTHIPVVSSLIDSNKYVIYNTEGVGTEYPCGEEWREVSYFIDTPESFTNDNALGFYNANYHGFTCEIDDVAVTKIGANSGIIVLYDEYSGTKEYFIGKDGEEFKLSDKDISDRANETTHVFEGWCKDAARTEKVEKIAFVKGSETYVYSRWKAPVVITFKNLADGSQSSITGNPGDSFNYPADPVDPQNKVWFVGWYADEAGTILHNSGKFGYANETIYAYFKGEAPGLVQDFENYIRDNYYVKTDANGQKYKSNRLYFAPTMSKQSAVTYNNSGYAIKYHWNPVQIEDKENENRYDTTRWAVDENVFNLGDGLDNNTVYNITFKYYVEKASAPIKFFTASAAWDNVWSNVTRYGQTAPIEVKADGQWHEYTIQICTSYKEASCDEIFLGVNNTANVETILYIDNVVIEAFAKPYESVITVNTGVNNKVVYIKGERGSKIELPALNHPDGAPLKGFCLDKELTVPFTETTYGKLPVTVYAKWGASPMTFESYLYESDKTRDPSINRVNEKGIGNGDDYAMQFKLERTEDDKTGLATTNALMIAEGIQNGKIYKVSYDYKVNEGSNVPLKLSINSADKENIWWNITYNYAHTAAKIPTSATNGWVRVNVAFKANVQVGESYGGNAEELYLRFSGQKYKAGEKIDVLIDNVLVEEIDGPVVFFDGQNESVGSYVSGEIGDKITFPTVTHPDGAKFIGWYADSLGTTAYTNKNFDTDFTVVYAKWGAFAMSFKDYPYESDYWKDPNINRVNEAGIGNGDDYAMRWYVNRKVTDTSNVGTAQCFRIASNIEDGAVYRIRYDYKASSKQNNDLIVRVGSADHENIWWAITHGYDYTKIDIPAGGTNGWQTYECYIRADVRSDASYGGVSEDLYLMFGGQTYKAGEYIDLIIDNVLVEKVEGQPFVFFDAETAAFFATGKVGDKIEVPTKLPTRVGYEFAGWYLEPECENKFTLENFEEYTAIIAYAKWKEASTYVYSFENYTCKEGINYTHSRGVLASNIKKSGKYSMSFGKDDPNGEGGVFAIEDGGVFYKLKTGTSYVVKVNYYIKEHSDVNMGIRFVAADYSNYYVAITNGNTGLTPNFMITAEQAKQQKGTWQTMTFAFDTSKLPQENGEDKFTQIYCFLSSGKGWEIYFDDISITPVAKGKGVVSFQSDGVKGLPEYLIGKIGESYADKVPEQLAKEGKLFKGYYTKDANGGFVKKERTAMVFGEAGETLFARFLDYQITENFDTGFYDKAYAKGLGYTIHDFDYEVYDSEKAGNSKDNVTSGRYSLHRKGDSMYKENSVILTLGNQIAEGERYTVSFKVKMGKHFHTDGAIKIVSSRSFQYAWTTTGDYYPVVAIADLADGQWHEVSYTFNSVEAFVTIQTPGYVELYMDDFVFTLADENTPVSIPIEFVEYTAAKRDANGNLIKVDRASVDISTIIDKSMGIIPTYTDWNLVFMIVGISVGGVAIIAAVVIFLFVLKKKKKANV